MKAYSSCQKSIEAAIENQKYTLARLYREEKPMGMHIHDCYEIYYSISGGKRFLIDNKYYEINDGDLFIINQYESHYLDLTDNGSLERIVINVYPDYLKKLSTAQTPLDSYFSNHSDHFCHKVHLSSEEQQRFIYYFHKVTNSNGYGCDIIEETSFIQMMVYITQLFHSQESDQSGDQQHYHYNQHVSNILNYINLHISDYLSIKTIADHFYLSESYICRLFKAETGTTINQYITARRISMAKAFLNIGYSVSEVCDKIGYQDYSNFLKAFTKIVGISPKKYAQYSTH